jgi:VanZ family protein
MLSVGRRLEWFLAAWCAFVVVASLLPHDSKRLTRTSGPLHHTVHIVAFAGVALGACARAHGRSWYTLLSVVGVTGLGALIELLQHHFYGSAYEWRDVWDDGFGALVGSLAASLIAVLIGTTRRDLS